jgi:hypothetical protein
LGVVLVSAPGVAPVPLRMRPSEWSRIAVLSLVAGFAAIVTGLVLLFAATALDLSHSAGLIELCVHAFEAFTPGGTFVGVVAGSVAVVVVGRAWRGGRGAWTRARAAEVEPWLGRHHHHGDFDLVVLPTEDLVAMTVPASRPQVVVSDGLISRLEETHVDAVLRHEASHRRHRHWRSSSRCDHRDSSVECAARNYAPSLALEAWADDDAAAGAERRRRLRRDRGRRRQRAARGGGLLWRPRAASRSGQPERHRGAWPCWRSWPLVSWQRSCELDVGFHHGPCARTDRSPSHQVTAGLHPGFTGTVAAASHPECLLEVHAGTLRGGSDMTSGSGGMGWFGPVIGLVVTIGLFGLIAWVAVALTRRPNTEEVDKMSTWRKVLIGLAIVVAMLVPAVAVYAVVDSHGGHGGSVGHPASGMTVRWTRCGQMSAMPGHMARRAT